MHHVIKWTAFCVNFVLQAMNAQGLGKEATVLIVLHRCIFCVLISKLGYLQKTAEIFLLASLV